MEDRCWCLCRCPCGTGRPVCCVIAKREEEDEDSDRRIQSLVQVCPDRQNVPDHIFIELVASTLLIKGNSCCLAIE